MGKYSVEITGINTNNLITLSRDEMNELFIKYQKGNKAVKDILVEGNLKLVLSILKRFNNKKYNLDDLFQIGVVGLIKAIDNFDLSFNCLFSTYAVPLIIGEIKRYIRDNTPLRISRSIKDNSYLILKFREDYFNKYGKEASVDDIKNNLNLSFYDIRLALDSLKEVMSIYDPIYSDQGDTIYLEEQISDKRYNNENKDNLISLRKSLEKLSLREQKILNERYIVGKTQSEIATYLNISQAQVSRIEKGAINRLKKLLK